jgi:hypothetical protein
MQQLPGGESLSSGEEIIQMESFSGLFTTSSMALTNKRLVAYYPNTALF